MSSEAAITAARQLGERAGRRFATTGIWPRNPFRTDQVADLAAAWRTAVFAATGPVTAPK